MRTFRDTAAFAWMTVSYSSDSTFTAGRALCYTVLRWIQDAYAVARAFFPEGSRVIVELTGAVVCCLQCLWKFAVSICLPRNASPRNERISRLARSVKRLIHVVEAGADVDQMPLDDGPCLVDIDGVRRPYRYGVVRSDAAALLRSLEPVAAEDLLHTVTGKKRSRRMSFVSSRRPAPESRPFVMR